MPAGCQSKKEVRGAAWPDSLRPRVSKYYGSRSKRPLNVVVVAYELRESQHHRLNSHTLSILTRSQCSHALNPHDPRTPSILTRPQSSHSLNPRSPSILTRPQSSHALTPHMLHVSPGTRPWSPQTLLASPLIIIVCRWLQPWSVTPHLIKCMI